MSYIEVKVSDIIPAARSRRYATEERARPPGYVYPDRRSPFEKGASLPKGMSLATGCKVYPDCLTCPLPKCVYDEPLQTQLAKSRLGEIFDLFDSGWSLDKISRHMKLTFVTVRNVIGRKRAQLDTQYTENEFLLGLQS